MSSLLAVARLLILVVLCGVASPASAELVERTGKFGGLQVTYKVVLPTGYEPARSYPVGSWCSPVERSSCAARKTR